MVKIALFGTSADPPTVGHQAILAWLAEQFDQVAIWAADNPFKDHQTALSDRSRMLELLIQDIHSVDNLALYPQLSDRRTLVTVERAQAHWPQADFTVVIGSDVVPTLLHWYQAERLFQQVKILVILRPGFPLANADLETLSAKGAQVEIANFAGPPVSSSAYREQGNSTGLTAAVQTYIDRQGLYQAVALAESSHPINFDTAVKG